MSDNNMQSWWDSSSLDGSNAAYLESLYEDYLKNPGSIGQIWSQYFAALPSLKGVAQESLHSYIQAEFLNFTQNRSTTATIGHDLSTEHRKMLVNALVQAYRLFGHLSAHTNPLAQTRPALLPELAPEFYGLPLDAQTTYNQISLTIQELIEHLKTSYCASIGYEIMHIVDVSERHWLEQEIEKTVENDLLEEKQQILDCLIAAEGLEKYLGAKYPGAKRFSLEGSDSLIVMLNELVLNTGESGIKEVVIGMAHRGRLNVLVNILGKNPAQLFDEFEGKHHHALDSVASGDVKYHQGFSSDVKTKNGVTHLSLAFNPSHLEIVSAVVLGSVRARQERRFNEPKENILPILIHGDAAFAGQGVVMETLNMSQTRGYCTAGSVHIIINNQIGFTTSDPADARSTLYCSDVAKMIQAPVFHVNGDDAEAVLKVTRLALKYRQNFKKDVVVDLISYRRHGHNEADEPAATQPLMYQLIRKKPTTLAIYGQALIARGLVTEQELKLRVENYRRALTEGQAPVVQHMVDGWRHAFAVDWTPYFEKDWRVAGKTPISLPRLQELAHKRDLIPDNWLLHPRVQKIVDDRKKMTQGELPIDWGYAETLAYATLVTAGYSVRLSGQDCGRGTFFHRHAVWHNQEDDQSYTSMSHLSEDQAAFAVYDSLLSEVAVMGFEYGYAATEPRSLVIWEAQFGDFANGAQVVIDQFISSGEQKWGRLCGLTLLLPHGYEGQGPEHSSARLERYLQLCAEHNMQVCIPSTPAQVFHLLRRQAIRPYRKPLIVMSPKSLLRHPLAVSAIEELSEGYFKAVLPEAVDLDHGLVTRVVLCSGKVYYDLLEARESLKKEDVVLIRIEQLYPFPEQELQEVLKPWARVKDVIWCQEEPQNQGAWYSCQHHFRAALDDNQSLHYAGRAPSAAPAAGYHHLHQEQQHALIKDALGL